MRPFTKREKILAALLLILAGTYFSLQYWFLPLFDKKTALEQEREELIQVWQEMEEMLGNREDLLKTMDQLKEELEKKQERLLPANSTSLYWQQVVQLAEAHGLSIIQIQEGNESAEESERRVHLQIRGMFTQLNSFLEVLKQIPYTFAIREGRFQLNNDEEVELLLTIHLHEVPQGVE